MITALVLVERGVEALAVTLSALVPAVADGLVADAVVLVRRFDAGVATVADAVGATLVAVPDAAPPWAAGAALARRDWVLCLCDGDVPQGDWARVVERFLAFGSGERLLARLARRPLELGPRTVELWDAAVGVRGPRPGDLAHRRILDGTARVRPVRLPAAIGREAPLK